MTDADTGRYMTQFRTLGDKTWDDSIAFGDLDRAREHVQAMVKIKPNLLLGRIFDREAQQVVETFGGPKA